MLKLKHYNNNNNYKKKKITDMHNYVNFSYTQLIKILSSNKKFIENLMFGGL